MSAATAYSKNNGFHKSSKTPWGNPVVYFFSLVLVAICVVPVLYIIFGGFRTNAQITNNPAGLPNPWVISNYKEVITSDIFWTELVNSLIVGICTMVGVVVLGIMVSYVIARYRFRYSALMYALFSAGLMFPMTVGITPLYLMIRNLGLSNSLAGIILPQIAFGLPAGSRVADKAHNNLIGPRVQHTGRNPVVTGLILVGAAPYVDSIDVGLIDVSPCPQPQRAFSTLAIGRQHHCPPQFEHSLESRQPAILKTCRQVDMAPMQLVGRNSPRLQFLHPPSDRSQTLFAPRLGHAITQIGIQLLQRFRTIIE